VGWSGWGGCRYKRCGFWLVFYAVPVGTFTFLFTDIEGSTALLGRVGQGVYAQVLADHHSIIRSGIAAHGGREVDTQGDAFFVVFSSPGACLAAVVQMQEALRAHAWPGGEHVRVRMGVHTGEASTAATGLVGLDVHRAARVAAAGHGGQVLLSEASAALVGQTLPPGTALTDLGVHRLKDLDRPERIFQLRGAGLQAEFPPLRTVPGGAAAATRTLPRDLASFTGRQRELDELVAAAADAGGVVGIHAIGGMAGVGKTALAVHAAHQLADRFPAGQIFLPLHGHTPGQQPVGPADALASLLLTAGVPAAQIPPGLEARMALWRDRLAERQLLLILDDAASSEQVIPLLPGTGGSLVLVTSRRHLSGLEDATAISLDTLPPDEAAALLVRLAGRPGLSPEDPAVAEITRLCGYLPLAVGMLARQLHHHPAWSLAGRAAELAAAVDRVALMATENLSVAAAFNLSYAELTSDQQRLFRRLGLHPGAEIDSYAVAALDGAGLVAADRGLEALYDQYLLTEPAQGRYRLHDLLRAHARALAGRLDPDGDRDEAVGRLLDYYQHVGALADALLARQGRTVSAAPAATRPAAVPALADQEQALAWARAERANLLGCLDYATTTGQHARVIAFTAGLAALLRQDGPWAEAIARHTTALRAAQRLGDRAGQATALNSLGNMRRLTGDYPGAARDLEEALGISRDLGDRLGQANALTTLGVTRLVTGDYPGAAEDLEEALGISRDLGDRLGQAWALNNLGIARRVTGDYPGAAEDLEEALGISRDLGDRLGQANALSSLGEVRQQAGDYPGAARDLEEALGIQRDIGNRPGQATALSILGEVRLATGDYPGAARDLEESLDISRDLGDRLGQANTLTGLGEVRRLTGDYPAAALDLEEALSIHRDLGNRGGEADALNEAGTLHRVCGDLRQAESCHRQALDLARQTGSSRDEAHALAGLGRCALAAGHAEAEDMLRQALEIFQQIGAAEAAEVSAELEMLTNAQPAAQES
jgi:class 3 adenylate cyclase/tetratricopeptide (TPR) repeat protein